MIQAILAAVCTKEDHFSESINECIELCKANDIEIIEEMIQNSDLLNKQTAFKSGKLEELRELVEEKQVELVVFYNHLSPLQISSIQTACNCTVLDRTGLILEIFSSRAKSKEAKLQVEIARLQYELPRLFQIEIDSDQQRGGVGVKNRGTGETKLELRKRDVEKRISNLKKELKQVLVSKSIQGQTRKKSEIPLVALVGYTNAGKSSIMNLILEKYGEVDKQVFVKDMLFATLDTQIRRITLDNKKTFLLSDTVGFVSDLPHHLIKAFESTLAIVKEADLILHVVDYSNPHMEMQMRTTNATLKDLQADDIPMIYVFNKIDIKPKEDLLVGEYISTYTSEGCSHLLETIERKLFPLFHTVNLLLPYSKGSLIDEIKTKGEIIQIEHHENGYKVECKCDSVLLEQLKSYILA